MCKSYRLIAFIFSKISYKRLSMSSRLFDAPTFKFSYVPVTPEYA